MSAKKVYIVKHSSGDLDVYSSLKRALSCVRNMTGINYTNVSIGAISNVELEVEFAKSRILHFGQFSEVSSIQIISRIVG